MRVRLLAVPCLALLLILSGCWSGMELTERAFVLGVALDRSSQANLRLTLQLYKPAKEEQGSSSYTGQSGMIYTNLQEEGTSVSDIIDNLLVHLGRNPQWSHMSMIVIGEALAREGMDDILDFFYRFPQVRIDANLAIVQGSASDYLAIKPLYENSSGYQLKVVQELTAAMTGNTANIDLRKFAIQRKSEAATAMIPYYYTSGKVDEKKLQTGLALMQYNRMTGYLDQEQTKFALMLNDKFRRGTVRMPCEEKTKDSKGMDEAIRLELTKSKLESKVRGTKVSIQSTLSFTGAVEEFRCTAIKNEQDTERFAAKAMQLIRHNIEHTVKIMKGTRTDILGIGNQIYRTDPSAWFRLKETWPQRFAGADFGLSIDLSITNTGVMTGKPVLTD